MSWGAIAAAGLSAAGSVIGGNSQKKWLKKKGKAADALLPELSSIYSGGVTSGRAAMRKQISEMRKGYSQAIGETERLGEGMRSTVLRREQAQLGEANQQAIRTGRSGTGYGDVLRRGVYGDTTNQLLTIEDALMQNRSRLFADRGRAVGGAYGDLGRFEMSASEQLAKPHLWWFDQKYSNDLMPHSSPLNFGGLGNMLDNVDWGSIFGGGDGGGTLTAEGDDGGS